MSNQQHRHIPGFSVEDQRVLVRDHFYEDLSHSQIAEKTGLPLGTVKSRLRLAFAKLKLRLEADAGASRP